jgi:hypothetical protein
MKWFRLAVKMSRPVFECHSKTGQIRLFFEWSAELDRYTVKVRYPDKFGYRTAVLAYNRILITGRPI